MSRPTLKRMPSKYCYAVTLRKTRKPVTHEFYYEYIEWLEGSVGSVSNLNFETTKGLHIHFVIQPDKGKLSDFNDFYRERFGWNLKVVPVYNWNGWKKYSEKDRQKWEDPVPMIRLLTKKLFSIHNDIEVTDVQEEIHEEIRKEGWSRFIEDTKDRSREDLEKECGN